MAMHSKRICKTCGLVFIEDDEEVYVDTYRHACPRCRTVAVDDDAKDDA